MQKILHRRFFEGKAPKVAQGLLGKYLVRKIGKKKIIGMITEVEAYDGFRDMASHASRGKTKRNGVMFGSGGYWYVYFTYGMHWMLNIVTGKKEYPAAVLIRAILIDGVSYKKTNGPAKLTKFLKIDKKLNAKPTARQSNLWIEDHSEAPKKIYSGKRIGVDYAGIWKDTLWRFYIEN
jgi:DNA-3-methyladenine glycosylase